jgi:hypothetical protein
MDMDEWDDLHGEAHDIDGYWCDATGDPQVDVSGYQSPSRRGQNLTGFTPSRDHRAADALAQSKRDREQRQQRRRAAVEANKRETRERGARGRGGGQVTARPVPAEPVQAKRDEIVRRSMTELQEGQHGAFFERRTYRPWYAPWLKKTRWQQISAWMATTPPRSGTEIVTVGSLDELRRVRTIGKVGPTGAVEW